MFEQIFENVRLADIFKNLFKHNSYSLCWEKTASQRRFPRIIADTACPLGKFGRDLLASSHAGTRLPIAVIRSPGRSPSTRCGLTADTALTSFHRGQQKNRRHLNTMPPGKVRSLILWLPPAALPASGSRVEVDYFLSACKHKLPCYFVFLIVVQTFPYVKSTAPKFIS